MPRNGFTLVELMIALSVMALLASAVVMTVGGGGNQPAGEAARFASRLAAARDRAVLSGRPISAWISPSGYGFDQHQQGRWMPLDERPFEAENWAAGTAVAATGRSGSQSRLRFDSLGLPDQPMEVALVQGERRATVRVSASGEVAVR